MKKQKNGKKKKTVGHSASSGAFGAQGMRPLASVCGSASGLGVNSVAEHEASGMGGRYDLKALIARDEAYLRSGKGQIDLGRKFRELSKLEREVPDLDDYEVERYLRLAVQLLAEHHLCLKWTNHLSDRALLSYIVERVFPEPLVIGPQVKGTLLYQECCPCDTLEWYEFYGDEMDRADYAEELGVDEPESRPLVSDRDQWLEVLAESYREESLP
jgi:hypothetical protein